MINLKEPWENPVNPNVLEDQLKKELHNSHYLYKFSDCMKAIARRLDNDDVIFEVRELGYVLVHLTWSNQDSNKYPIYRMIPTDFAIQEQIEKDYLDYLQ